MFSAPPINKAALSAFVALMRRWCALVLLWLARLPMKRSLNDIARMEWRLRYLIAASVLIAGVEPGKARMGSHLVGRSYEGAWTTFVLRSALPRRAMFRHDPLARIKHVCANIDFYVKRFMRKLARGLLVRRCGRRGELHLALISHAPIRAIMYADTS